MSQSCWCWYNTCRWPTLLNHAGSPQMSYSNWCWFTTEFTDGTCNPYANKAACGPKVKPHICLTCLFLIDWFFSELYSLWETEHGVDANIIESDWITHLFSSDSQGAMSRLHGASNMFSIQLHKIPPPLPYGIVVASRDAPSKRSPGVTRHRPGRGRYHTASRA